MKKSLLLSAALLVAGSAFADYYVIGADVNGKSWELKASDALMTDKGNGIYEWNGQTLGTAFKINDGTWDEGAPNIGNSGSKIQLGVAYTYAQNGGDIMFDGFGTVTNPKVVLNVNDNTITLTGEAEEVDPSAITYYIIGSNVNGQSWALAQPDAAFEPQGNGIYRWEGEVLGSGFKINDGSWGDINIGGAGAEISMNEPYTYWNNGSSGNIPFNGFTEVLNPVVELNINDETITIIGGNAGGEAQWYVAGINGVYELNDNWVLSPVAGKENVFSRVVEITESAGVFKISDDGWSHQYGTEDQTTCFIDPYNLSAYLDVVNGEGGDVPYELEAGNWVVTWDLNELMVTFAKSDAGVEDLVMGSESKVVYFNLQGQKVLNPDRGIFVKVVDGKATKVVK